MRVGSMSLHQKLGCPDWGTLIQVGPAGMVVFKDSCLMCPQRYSFFWLFFVIYHCKKELQRFGDPWHPDKIDVSPDASRASGQAAARPR